MTVETEVPWPIEVLTRVGFHPHDAAHLQPLLPPVEAGALTFLSKNVDKFPLRGRQEVRPGAYVLWALHPLTIEQAHQMTSAGRGLIDVLALLDALGDDLPKRLSMTGFNVATEWVRQRNIPRHRFAVYIRLGFTAAQAGALESSSAGSPPEDALEMLAALRRPVF